MGAKNMGNVKVRGQTKTHKTVQGGIIQTGGTKKCLVTSTFPESEMYADAGFDDIMFFPGGVMKGSTHLGE